MKKFLSILLTLCLLLAPMGALAESGATQLTIDMIELTIGDNDPIELDLSLLLTLLNGDAGQSLSLAVNDAEGNPILAGGLSVAEDGLTGVMDWNEAGEVTKTPKAVVIKDGVYTAIADSDNAA